MKRLVHLISTQADGQLQAGAQALANASLRDWTCSLVAIGPGQRLTNGLSVVRWLRGQPVDLVHAWGVFALAMAALGARCPVIHTPPAELSERDERWIRRICRVRPIRVIVSTPMNRDALLAGGLPREQCEYIAPGIDIRAEYQRNEHLRAALGFDPDSRVLLAVGESTRSAGHEKAVWAAGILNVLDPRYRLLAIGSKDHSLSLGRFSTRLRQPGLTTLARESLSNEVTYEDLLQIADVALVTSRGTPETRAVAMTMAAGVPIVARPGAVTPGLIDASVATIAEDNSPRGMARGVMDIFESPPLAQTKAARDRARRDFAMPAFVQRHLQQYDAMYGMSRHEPTAVSRR